MWAEEVKVERRYSIKKLVKLVCALNIMDNSFLIVYLINLVRGLF